MFDALVRVSNALVEVAQFLGQKAGQIYTVYLIGPYLAPLFAGIAIKVMSIASNVNDFRGRLEDFRNDIQGQVQGNPVLSTLAWYANALIDFIRNPYPTIVSVVRGAFNYLEWMYYNAYDFIFPHVIRLLDTYFPQWRDLYGFVVARISEQFQDFNMLRYNPVQWVIDRLRAYSYNVGRFLQDPDGYIIERMSLLFPALREFLIDPADYIIQKLADRLENFADRNMARIIKIAENIISAIF